MPQDKQLRGVSLDAVVEKRRLDQALNAKEFAVLAGISYSTARTWFRVPGFPVFRGVIFWQDFVDFLIKLVLNFLPKLLTVGLVFGLPIWLIWRAVRNAARRRKAAEAAKETK